MAPPPPPAPWRPAPPTPAWPGGGGETGATPPATRNPTGGPPESAARRRPLRSPCRYRAWLAITDSGIQKPIHQVRDQVEEHDQRGVDEGDRHYHRRVVGEDRLDEEGANA